MNQFKLLIIILFAFVVAVFSVSNPQPATLKFFGKEVFHEIPTVIVVLGAILTGVLLTAILGFLMQTKLKKKISKLTKENTQLKEKEEKLQLKIREFEEKLEETDKSIPQKENQRENDY